MLNFGTIIVNLWLLDFKHYECKLMRHVLSFLEKKIILGGQSQENYTEQTNVHCICSVL